MGWCFEDVCLESPDIQRIRDAEGDLARLEREKNWEKLKFEMEHVAKLGEIKDEIALKKQVENWSPEANLPHYHGESGLGGERYGWLGLHADAHW